MVIRNHPRGRLVFDRDAIVRAALRAYVEALVADLPNGLWLPVCEHSRWEGNFQHGAFYNDDGCGGHEVIAWTEAGVVGLAYELGWGPIEQLGLSVDAITSGPEDVRGALPGLPDELEPAFVNAVGMLPAGSGHRKGGVLVQCLDKLAGVGFWLYGDKVGGTLFDNPTFAGIRQLLPWGMLQNDRLPFWVIGELAPQAAERARTTDAPIHAIIDTVTDRALKGPTEFTADELAILIPKPPDPQRLLGAQRALQTAGITWPGSPEIPPLPPPPKDYNPFRPRS